MVQSCTELYRNIRNSTLSHRLLQGVKGRTDLYGEVQNRTEFYGVVQNSTKLYGVLTKYTE